MTNRTPKGKALGKALRQERKDRDIGLRELAALMSRDPGVMSRWETGERTPAPEHVARMLTLLGVPQERYDEIMRLVHGTGDARWVAVTLPEQRRQLTALIEFEQTASEIIEVHPMLISGLLQSPSYIQAALSGGGLLSPEDIATLTEIRDGRQKMLTRRNPARLTALIGEAALRNVLGGPEAMVEQCKHLLTMARMPNVNLLIVPFGSGWRPSLDGPFIMIESESEMPVVHLELRRSSLFLHEDEDVAAYREAVVMERRAALGPVDSAKMVLHYLKGWEQA